MAPSSSVKSPPTRLLIADHDAQHRQALGHLLSSFGFETALIGSVSDLLECCPSVGPSALILEYRFQGMNGLDLHARLVKRGLSLPVIFVSDRVEVGVAVKAIKAGAIDFLVRPFSDEDIAEAVHAAIELDSRQKALFLEHAELQELYLALTPREREVMWHATSGLLNKQIAGRLGLSEITIKVHRGHVMRKMQARSFAELVTKANALRSTGVLEEEALRLPNRALVPHARAAPLRIAAAALPSLRSQSRPAEHRRSAWLA